MRHRTHCPECEARDTQRVYIESFADYIEETRICNECPAQYTLSFGDMQVISIFQDGEQQ